MHFQNVDEDSPQLKWYKHTGQCKRTGGRYNELVVAFQAQVVA